MTTIALIIAAWVVVSIPVSFITVWLLRKRNGGSA